MAQVAERQRQIRVGPLSTVGNVIVELARVYRHARHGQIDTLDASRLAGILTQIRQALEEQEFERRIRALEEHDAAKIGGPTSATGRAAAMDNGANGHDDVRIGSPSVPDHGNRREGRRP